MIVEMVANQQKDVSYYRATSALSIHLWRELLEKAKLSPLSPTEDAG
jgi:hypothetical protein